MTEAQGPEVEPEPAAAVAVFGDRLELARSFTAELSRQGETLGLIGPRERAQLWSRHILNSAVIGPLLQGSVADVGSGAGLPGLVAAIARPDVRMTLIEPMERRCAWLTSEADRLGLRNVRVRRARAQEVVDEQFDQVTARAVSALRTLIPMTAPLVRDGGTLLLMKGARVHEERSAASNVMRKHQVSNVEVLELGAVHGLTVTRVLQARVRA